MCSLGYSGVMRTILIMALVSLSMASSADTELYKWRDKDGLWHYSDVPEPGAEKIIVQDAPTVSAPVQQPSTAVPVVDETAIEYEKFAIAAPPNNGIVRDNTGAVTVSVEVVPALRLDLGHTVKVTLAGQTQGGAATEFKFSGIDRGTHTVTASLLDKDGTSLMSASATFTLHRISKLTKPAPRP
jgi:hypothetical protein